MTSGHAALVSALVGLGIGPGDEVIVPAYTYTATASVVCHVGATPVLCDTAPDSYEMDYDQLRRLYEQWQGRTFLCTGNIVDAYEDNGSKYVVMDVGTDGEHAEQELDRQHRAAELTAQAQALFSAGLPDEAADDQDDDQDDADEGEGAVETDASQEQEPDEPAHVAAAHDRARPGV